MPAKTSRACSSVALAGRDFKSLPAFFSKSINCLKCASRSSSRVLSEKSGKLATRPTGVPFGIGPTPSPFLLNSHGGPPPTPSLNPPKFSRDISPRDFQVAACRSALHVAGDFVPQQRVLLTLFRPEHLLDRLVERRHTRLDTGLSVERSESVIEQERRRRPQAD